MIAADCLIGKTVFVEVRKGRGRMKSIEQEFHTLM